VSKVPPAAVALEKLGIPHHIFRHAEEVTSLEQAARERGQRPQQVVRSLVFRIAARQFVMVLVPGGTQVSWKKLRGHAGRSRLTTATPEEVLEETGYRIGTVAPFGLRHSMMIVLDNSILREGELSIGSGEAGVGILLSTESLLRALPGAQLADLIDPT
jgi:Cys-tRNA(Pro)/Cys-tRNA(Cys) deacylase